MGVKFSLLDELVNLTGEEYFPIVRDYDNFIVQLNTIKASITKVDIGLGNVDNTPDLYKPISNSTQLALDAKANLSHGHLIDSIPGLQLSLDSKADELHNHGLSDINGLQTSLAAKSDLNHGHNINDVSGLQSALDTKATIITVNGKANTVHMHNISDIAGLQNALAQAGLSVDLSGKADTVHTHVISDIASLQIVLNSKSDTGHTHTVNNIPGLQTILNTKIDITQLDNRISQLTGLAPGVLDTFEEFANAINNDANFAATIASSLSGKANITHTHAIADTTGLQAALDSKASPADITLAITPKADAVAVTTALAGKAALVHNHAVTDIVDLQTTIDNAIAGIDLPGKANVIHSHAITDSIGLQSALNDKADTNDVNTALASKANILHNHAIANITNLQTALDDKATQVDLTTGLAAKANTSHSHAIIDITGLQTALNDKASVASLADKADVSSLANKADTGHTHTVGNITGLQAALDSKSDTGHTHTNLLPSGVLNNILTHDGNDWVTGYIPYDLSFAVSDESTAITVGSGKLNIRSPRVFKLTNIYASLSTAQVSGSLFTIDVRVNGSSVFSTLLTFNNTEKISSTATTLAVLTSNPLQINLLDEITVVVTQVGDSTAKGLKIYLVGHL